MKPEKNLSYRTLEEIARRKRELRAAVREQQAVLSSRFDRIVAPLHSDSPVFGWMQSFTAGFSLADKLLSLIRWYRVFRTLFHRSH